jgi:hypothetical protein
VPARTGKVADRTRARHADVRRLPAEARRYRDTVAGLGLSRNTVRRFARAASPEELLVTDGTGQQPSSVVDQFRETLPLLGLNLIENAENPRERCDLHRGRPPNVTVTA